MFIPPKFGHSVDSVELKGGQIHLLDVHPSHTCTGDLPSAKLQWDEHWLKSLTHQTLKSVLFFSIYSGSLPFKVRYFSTGNRRDCSSAGRRRL